MAKVNLSNSSHHVYVCLGNGIQLNDLVEAIQSDKIDVEVFDGSSPGITPVIVVKKAVKQ